MATPTHAKAIAALALVAMPALLGCKRPQDVDTVQLSTTPAVAPSAGVAASAVVAPTPSAPVPLGRWAAATTFADLGAGRSGAVVGGRRVVLAAGQATVLDPRPVATLGAHVVHLPESLGGGWLFVGPTSVHFGRTFDGALRRVVAGLDEGSSVGVGADGVLVHRGKPEVYRLSTGEPLALPVDEAEEMFGVPSGQVAVRTSRGQLYSSAHAGAPFVKVAAADDVTKLAYDGKGIVVQTKSEQKRLDAEGHLAPRVAEPGMTVTDDLAALAPWPDLSRSPYDGHDVERMLEPLTVAMSPAVAVAIRETTLVVFDATTGRVTAERPGVFAGHENCSAIRGGTPAFVGCNDKGQMALFRLDAPDRPPVLERAFPGVYTQDFGSPGPDAPLALARPCVGPEVRGAFCVRKGEGSWVDVPPPPDPEHLLASFPFVVHVAAGADGAPFAFGWQGGGGDLIIVDGGAHRVRRIAKSALAAWPGGGVDWYGLSVRDDALHFLVGGTRADATSGILDIAADGQVHGEAIAGKLAALGDRGLLVTPSGAIRETLDGGRTFHDVPSPPGGLGADGARASFFLRCVPAGCSVGPWHRLGWGP